MDDAAIGVALVDIDNFRLLNETYGHEAGDEALRTVVESLRRALPDDVAFGRYGPDELLLVAPAGSVGSMVGVLEGLRATLADHSLQFGASERLPLTISAGVCIYPDHADSVTALLTVVAVTLQEARASGGDAIRVAGSSEIEPENRTFDVFQGLIFAVDTKDRYTKQHSEDVARYGVFLATRLGLDPEVIATIRVAGLLHDVGKIGVPDHILRKPGTLTAAEYDIVKQHVALGDLIVRDLPDVDVIRAGVRHHHERWDGDGLPRSPVRRGHPPRRADPRGRRCVLGDDHDASVPKGDEHRRGAATPRGCRWHAARRAPGQAVRRRHRDGGGCAAARCRCRLIATVDALPTGPDRRLMRDRGRSSRAITRLALAVSLCALAGGRTASVLGASPTWVLDATPSAIEAALPTTIDVTFSKSWRPDRW